MSLEDPGGPTQGQGELEPDGAGSGEGPGAPTNGSQGLGFVRLGLLFYGVLAAAAVVWRVGFYGEAIWYSPGAGSVAWLRDGLLGAAVAGALIAGSDWMTRTTRWGDALARALAEALGPLSLPDALLLAVASGFAEELFFRGALQPRVGWVLASLLFGSVHFVPRREFLPWTGFAIGAGFAFGGLFLWTGNLVAPVVAHTIVNAVNLPLLVRRYGPSAGA